MRTFLRAVTACVAGVDRVWLGIVVLRCRAWLAVVDTWTVIWAIVLLLWYDAEIEIIGRE